MENEDEIEVSKSIVDVEAIPSRGSHQVIQEVGFRPFMAEGICLA